MIIGQYISNCPWGDLIPETMKKSGLGGRETALLKLSENWAKQGHTVINFVPTQNSIRVKYENGGKEHFVPHTTVQKYCEYFGLDILVSWEEPKILYADEIRDNVKLKIIEMQVAHISTAPLLDECTDYYAVLSAWAQEQLHSDNPFIDKEKFVIFKNGVDLARYKTEQENRFNKREFYYSSSPDRGLVNLLRAWPKIRNLYPDAVLNVAYGIESWASQTKWSHNMQSEVAIDVETLIKQPGINYLGKIGQDELARVQESCTALLYPCDTMQPTETGCITVVEAGAAGCPAIITNCDCLESEFSHCAAMVNLPFSEDEYVKLIERVLTDKGLYDSLVDGGRELAASRSWDKIAYAWTEFFQEKLGE